MNLQIYRAKPEHAGELSQIALAAKAHWGYPQRWLEIWRPQLTFHPQYFEENEGWVAYVDETLVGFYTLQEKNETAFIENLWVSPEHMGKGVGKALFLHAVELSREHGNTTLQLEADPNAVGFYKRMGMSQIGEVQYELEGQPRSLPIMEMKL
jgi:ribosomal protein S18 acetylase RimI-like enzyme